jgi:flagellar biosynthesis protein FlhG
MPKEKRPEKNYYDILRVSRAATRQDVVKAYEQIKEAFGPQSMAVYSLVEEEERRSIMDKIEKAFSVLTDDVRRAKYNAQIDRPTDANDADQHKEELPSDESKEIKTAVKQKSYGEEFVDTPRATEASTPDPANKSAKTDEPSKQEPGKDKSGDESPTTKKKTGLPFDPSKFSDFDGKALKQIREALEIDLSDVCDKTKIGKTFLQFLEDNKYEYLPAEVYVKGFVKQIAAMYGLNSAKVAESYIALYKKGTAKKQ